MNSTPPRSFAIMCSTALPPQPPTPMTLMIALSIDGWSMISNMVCFLSPVGVADCCRCCSCGFLLRLQACVVVRRTTCCRSQYVKPLQPIWFFVAVARESEGPPRAFAHALAFPAQSRFSLLRGSKIGLEPLLHPLRHTAKAARLRARLLGPDVLIARLEQKAHRGG